MSENNCILWGGYAWGNAGDELTLAVALSDIQQRFGKNVAIISPNPGYTQAVFQSIEAIPYHPTKRARRVSPLARLAHSMRGNKPGNYELNGQEGSLWAKAIRKSQLLYLVGGGYLNDLFDFESFVLPVRVAKHWGIPIQTAPLGIGPFHRDSNARLFAETFRAVKLTVRDDASLKLCRSLGLHAEKRPDDGFRAAAVLPVLPDRHGVSGVIGLNIHAQAGDISNASAQRWWTDTLALLRSMDLPLEGFCFHNSPLDDYSATAGAFSSAGLNPADVRHPHIDFRDACLQLARYRVVVTSRFHAVVTAGVMGIPALAVANGAYYESKMKAACDGHSCGKCADILVITPKEAATWIGEQYHARNKAI